MNFFGESLQKGSFISLSIFFFNLFLAFSGIHVEDDTLRIYSIFLSYREASVLQIKGRDVLIKVQNQACWLDQIFHSCFLAPALVIC